MAVCVMVVRDYGYVLFCRGVGACLAITSDDVVDRGHVL